MPSSRYSKHVSWIMVDHKISGESCSFACKKYCTVHTNKFFERHSRNLVHSLFEPTCANAWWALTHRFLSTWKYWVFLEFNQFSPLNMDRNLAGTMMYSGVGCFLWECKVSHDSLHQNKECRAVLIDNCPWFFPTSDGTRASPHP